MDKSLRVGETIGKMDNIERFCRSIKKISRCNEACFLPMGDFRILASSGSVLGGGRYIMDSRAFLRPKLVGTRFAGHAIPLEFLRDLAVLNEMIQEGARAEFKKANPIRERVPAGFTEDFSLVMTGIEEGSAIPVITLLAGMVGFFPNGHVEFYEKARDSVVAAIRAVAANESPTEYLSPKTLAYFKNFGMHLREGEAIEFANGPGEEPVRLTKDTRRKLLLALPETREVTEEVELRGLMKDTNQGEKSFVLKLADGSEVTGAITGDHYDNIIEATAGYRQGAKLFLRGVGARDRQGRLIRIASIEQTDVLDPLDIPARFEELRLLKDGWLDGVGNAPTVEGMNWLESSLRSRFRGPLPRIFAAPEGTLVLEWTRGSVMASLEVDLEAQTGTWHVFNTATFDDRDDELNLAVSDGWATLDNYLNGLYGEVGA